MNDRELLIAGLAAKYRCPANLVKMIVDDYEATKDGIFHTGGGYYEYRDGLPVVGKDGKPVRGKAKAIKAATEQWKADEKAEKAAMDAAQAAAAAAAEAEAQAQAEADEAMAKAKAAAEEAQKAKVAAEMGAGE